jgi:beta-xylosidase
MQQKASEHRQQACEAKQRQVSQTHASCHSDHAVTKVYKESKHYKSELKAEAKLRTQKSKEMKKCSRRISDDTKCPIHPMANHTWGKCYSNAANKNKPKTNSEKAKKRPEKTKKDEVDGHAAHLANNYMSITLSTTAHGTQDFLSTTSEPCCQQAVNDNLMVSTINNGMFAQLCLDLNHQALVAKFKAACAAATNTEVHTRTMLLQAP